MATYADIRAVDLFISDRIAKNRWVIAPSMISSALDWDMTRTVEALSEIYRQQVYKLKPSLVVLCDHCLSEMLADSMAQAIFDGKEPIAQCNTCGKPFHCTEDNTRISFHVLPSDCGDALAAPAGKEYSDGLSADVRQ
ncbi:hypothetical protein LBMAG53_00210 [Planctomycetota bacterium]|nr:hypothetical protein LBMAG53_00210 [Planctomycetota bacterium]